MDRESALRRLSPAYEQALRLRDRGLDEQAIAQRLNLAAEAVGTLLLLGEAKLARLMDGQAGNGSAPRK
jgi:DNA-directed RNA polymerase specialized sigma24 family protein